MIAHLITEQRGSKLFLLERHVKSMRWPANCSDLNPVENLWWQTIPSNINSHCAFNSWITFSLVCNWFPDEEVLFQEGNASCHRANRFRSFFPEKRGHQIIWIEIQLKIFGRNLNKWSLRRLCLPKKIYKLPFRKVDTILIKNIALN